MALFSYLIFFGLPFNSIYYGAKFFSYPVVSIWYMSTIKFVICSVPEKDDSYIMSSTCQSACCSNSSWRSLVFLGWLVPSSIHLRNYWVLQFHSEQHYTLQIYLFSEFPICFTSWSASWFYMVLCWKLCHLVASNISLKVSAWQVLNCNDLFWSFYCWVLNSAYDSSFNIAQIYWEPSSG